MNNKVTIIIPVYNSEKYIQRCLDSCINQTYKNIEILVINDGSTDRTKQIITKIKDKRIIMIDKKNSGVSDSRNVGLSKARGKYIMFLDSDDWLDQDAVKQMVQIISKENIDAIRFNYRIATIENNQIKFKKPLPTKFEKENKNNIGLIDVLNGDIYCYVWLLMIKKSSLTPEIAFDNKLAMMEDNDFFIQILLNKINIKYVNLPIYNYYIHNQSESWSPENYIRNGKNILYLQKKVLLQMTERKILNKEYETAIKTNTVSLIANILKDLHKYNKHKFREFYQYLNKSNDYILAINNYNKKNLSITQTIITKCTKNKLLILLQLFLSVREKIIRLIKG